MKHAGQDAHSSLLSLVRIFTHPRCLWHVAFSAPQFGFFYCDLTWCPLHGFCRKGHKGNILHVPGSRQAIRFRNICTLSLNADRFFVVQILYFEVNLPRAYCQEESDQNSDPVSSDPDSKLSPD